MSCVFGEFGSEEEKKRFLLLWFFFYCARDQFPDEELSMVTSWLPTEWLVLTEVETLLWRAGCSLVRSLDLAMSKFVFLCLDVDCGIILLRGLKSWSLPPQLHAIRPHTSCCRYSEYVGNRRQDYEFCYFYRLWR